jgi:FtsH-binding integral membrane protein
MNNVVRGTLIAILSLALVGFGLCGAIGTLSGLAGISKPSTGGGEDMNLAPAFLMYGLIGLAIAGVCLFFILRLQRKRPPGGA